MVIIFCSEKFAHDHGSTDTDAGYAKDDNIHYRTGSSYCRQGVFSDETPHNDGVYCIVSQLKQIPQNQGNGIGDNVTGNASLGHMYGRHDTASFITLLPIIIQVRKLHNLLFYKRENALTKPGILCNVFVAAGGA